MLIDPRMSSADILQLRKNLGVDQPVHIQFFKWANQVLHGNFGYSYCTTQPVLDMIKERLPATLLLSVSTLAVILLLTFPLGLISAHYANRWPDHAISIITFTLMSIPTFWIGLMLIMIFSVHLNWLPASGFSDPLAGGSGQLTIITSVAQHLILPLISSVLGGLAVLTRYYRFGVINVLKQPYILAAKARGIRPVTIITSHAFKNAALPVVTLLGLELPGLIGGAFIIEYIFAWPGLGQMGIAAAFARDYPVLMGTLFFTSVLIVVGNLISDLTYAYIDPRIRRPK